jgi:GT2 family glycosyltransferase
MRRVLSEPAISVVVATHNRSSLLPRLVHALERQTGLPSFEVVVVDDASTDDTRSVLERLRAKASVPLKVLSTPRNAGPATARNLGWRAAGAPLVAFTDDDCTPDPGWLAALRARLDEADLVQGRTLSDPDGWPARSVFARTVEVTFERGFYETCNMGYRRALLERLGGFDESFRHPFGEDADLAWRALEAGARSAFEPDALVIHAVWPSSFGAHLREAARRDGIVRAVGRHPQLRSRLHRRWFYQQSHPYAIAAAVGLGLCARGAARRRLSIIGLALVAPYADFRLRVKPVRGRRRNLPALVALLLAGDLAEIAVLARASARYRTLVL